MEVLLKELIEVIRAQTDAIKALAASNIELIQAIAEAEDLPSEPTKYLDGTKRS